MGYSSDRFYRDWRYAIEKEFVDPSGEPFEYAENGKQSWGDELKCLKFNSSPNTAAVSHDGKYLAIAVDQEIHVLNIKTNDLSVLRAEPTIIFWDLNAHTAKHQLSSENIASVSKHAVRTVVERLTDLDSSLHLAQPEQDILAEAFKPSISQALARNNVSSNVKLDGRLVGSFQSNVFSPSGRYMMYLPGSRPPSNGDEQWDIKVYSMEEKKDVLTLVGHRDAVMWMGYSPDETLIGTVGWDKTMRIWYANNGELRNTFETTNQNWTGGFSPDGAMFAGTCGDGSVHVYSVSTGNELFWSNSGKGWCRALDWSPDSRLLAVGGRECGKVVLIDVKKRAVVQERALSTRRAKVEEDTMLRFLGGFLEVNRVKFADSGKKIVHFTSGDGSAEVYDLEKCHKWRFARTGTDSYSDAVADLQEGGTKNEQASSGGFEMLTWENIEQGLVMLASVDGDAVRLWSVPLTSD